jgi:hypothetical protein
MSSPTFPERVLDRDALLTRDTLLSGLGGVVADGWRGLLVGFGAPILLTVASALGRQYLLPICRTCPPSRSIPRTARPVTLAGSRTRCGPAALATSPAHGHSNHAPGSRSTRIRR